MLGRIGYRPRAVGRAPGQVRRKPPRAWNGLGGFATDPAHVAAHPIATSDDHRGIAERDRGVGRGPAATRHGPPEFVTHTAVLSAGDLEFGSGQTGLGAQAAEFLAHAMQFGAAGGEIVGDRFALGGPRSEFGGGGAEFRPTRPDLSSPPPDFLLAPGNSVRSNRSRVQPIRSWGRPKTSG